MSKNPCCIRAVPYENGAGQSLTMCLYMDTNGERIPNEIDKAAKEMFKNYEIVDLHRLPLSKIVQRLSPSERQEAKDLADLSRTIEKNLHLFENRMNVTALKASYKVTSSIEKDTPCVTVFVLGKGKIPAGDTDIKEIKNHESGVFKETEFDVAEGYYKLTNGPSLEGYARHLQSGVGIGVQGVGGAGTLGGFLEDEKGDVYILSNEHVLHPYDAGEKKVIVQPSELDYNVMHEETEKILKQHTKKIKNIRAKNNEESNSVLEETEREEKKEKERLSEIEKGKPRRIGEYDCGLKGNCPVGDKSVYVDVAIASLDKKKLSEMKSYKKWEDQTNRCPVYGFETNKYWNTKNNNYSPPNDEIVDFNSFQEQLRMKELRFMKIGKKSGFTNEGCLTFIDAPLHLLNIRVSEDINGLCHIRRSFCEDCIQLLVNPNHSHNPGENEHNAKVCTTCEKKLDNVHFFWARNCFPVQKRGGPFVEKGDSGALLFDKDGRAWGLAYGTFDDLRADVFTLMTPLCVALDALKQKSGKKELKLW